MKTKNIQLPLFKFVERPVFKASILLSRNGSGSNLVDKADSYRSNRTRIEMISIWRSCVPLKVDCGICKLKHSSFPSWLPRLPPYFPAKTRGRDTCCWFIAQERDLSRTHLLGYSTQKLNYDNKINLSTYPFFYLKLCHFLLYSISRLVIWNRNTCLALFPRCNPTTIPHVDVLMSVDIGWRSRSPITA